MRFTHLLTALSLFTASFLGMSTAAHAEMSATCRSRMLTELSALIKEDDGKILAAQFKITTLKLAMTLNHAKKKTFESWIKRETQKLAKSDKKHVREKLEKLYATYGEGEDRRAFLEKLKGTDYFKLPLRFTNAEVAVYLRAHSAVEEKSPFDRLDSAVIWAQSKISDTLTAQYGKGSKEANMAEISTLSASHTGMMKGLKKKSDSQIKTEMEKLTQEVEDGFNTLSAKFSNDLKRDCEQCADCGGVNSADKKDLLADLFERSEIATQAEEVKEEKEEVAKVETIIAKSPKLESYAVLSETTTDDFRGFPSPRPGTKYVKIGPPEYDPNETVTTTAIAPSSQSSNFSKTSWSPAEVSALSSQISTNFLANPQNQPENVNRYRDGRLSSYLRLEDYPEKSSKGLSRADVISQSQPIPPNLVAKIRRPQPLGD